MVKYICKWTYKLYNFCKSPMGLSVYWKFISYRRISRTATEEVSLRCKVFYSPKGTKDRDSM